MFNESNLLGLVSQFEDRKFDERTSYQFQGRLRSGDFNIDGYPDIFLTVKKENKLTKEVTTESLVLINTLV